MRHGAERQNARRHDSAADQHGANAGQSGPHSGGADQIGDRDRRRQPDENSGKFAAGRLPAVAPTGSQQAGDAWDGNGRPAAEEIVRGMNRGANPLVRLDRPRGRPNSHRYPTSPTSPLSTLTPE